MALDRAVVEVDVRELRLAEVGLQPLPGLAAHREAVVLRGDRDPAGAQVLDRVVAAAVAEGSLNVSSPTAWESSWWPRQMPNTGVRPISVAHRLDEVAERRRVARAGDEEDAVRAAREQLVGRRGAGQQLERRAARGEVAHDRALDAGVERDDARARAVALRARGALRA